MFLYNTAVHCVDRLRGEVERQTNQIEALRIERAAVEAELAEAKRTVEEAVRQRASLYADIDALIAEKEDCIRTNYDDWKAELRAEIDHEVLTEFSRSIRKYQEMEVKVRAMQQEHAVATAERHEALRELERTRARVGCDVAQILAEKQKAVAAVNTELIDARRDLQEARTAKSRWDKTANEVIAQVRMREAQSQALAKKVATLTAQSASAATKLAALKAELTAAEEQTVAATKRAAQSEQRATKAQQQTRAAEARANAAGAQANAATKAAAKAETARAELQRDEEVLSSRVAVAEERLQIAEKDVIESRLRFQSERAQWKNVIENYHAERHRLESINAGLRRQSQWLSECVCKTAGQLQLLQTAARQASQTVILGDHGCAGNKTGGSETTRPKSGAQDSAPSSPLPATLRDALCASS